jgi:type IV pilus assembly protein PilM
MLEQLQRIFPGINLRPALACEISPYGVMAARQDQASGLLTQFVPLVNGILPANARDGDVMARQQLVDAVALAVGAVAERGRALPGGRTMAANRALTLILPDAMVRVLLLDFDTLPSKRVEALSILRFRIRKLVPFETDDAAISWQAIPQAGSGLKVLAIVIPREVLREYEGIVREAGFLPGVVLPSTLAALPLIGSDAALVVNRNGNTLTTTILRGQELLLHRALDFGGGEEATAQGGGPVSTGTALPSGAAARMELEDEDIRQSVSVAMAYFEDTLAAAPTELCYIGPRTSEEVAAALGDLVLGEPALAVRTLGGRTNETRPGQAAPPVNLLAPVMGALFNA